MADRGNWNVQIGADTLASYSDVVKREPVDGEPFVEELTQPFGTTKVWFERGNFSATRHLNITREFASNKAAHDFFETAAQTYNGVRDVLLKHRDYTGGVTIYKITAAHVKVVVEEPTGVSIFNIKVAIAGGLAVLQ